MAAAITLAGGRAQVADPWRRLHGMLPPLMLGSLLTSARLPGGSYVTTWPLLSGAAGALAGAAGLLPRPAAATVAAIGGVALLSPLSRLLYDGLTPRLAGVSALTLQVAGELSAPALWSLPPRVRRVLGVAAGSVAGGLVARRVVRPPGAAQPPQTLSYLMDVSTGRALYLSTDPAPTEWTRRYLGAHPRSGLLPGQFPGWQRQFLYAPAAPVDLPAPVCLVVADKPAGVGRRRVRLRVHSPRAARQISLSLPSGCVANWSVAGRTPSGGASTGPGQVWELWLYALGPDGAEVEVDLPEVPVQIRIADRTDGGPGGGTQFPAAALDADAWGNGIFVMDTLTI